ncbi:NAD-glutamate dehydrogenase [Ostreiculturibacter nitratireducens]|uniref:NAD-glutamate dehydrogenase n=1 Tax=Ostreiculturibacter nitratireducens TaxID=3075226 RepID=UPI0031B5AD3A
MTHDLKDRLRTKLDEVKALSVERLGRAEAEAFGEVLDRFYSHAIYDDIADEPANAIYGAALALWKLGAKRMPGRPKIRVYNPRMEEHGWESGHTVIEVINDDMPFLVDSLTVLFNDRGLGVHRLLHPVVTVDRDAKGERRGLCAPDAKGAVRESLIQAQIDEFGDADALAELETAVEAVLNDVRLAVSDWRPMLHKLEEVTEAVRAAAPKGDEAFAEAAEFLDWLADNHFTFLGYREYKVGAKGAEVVAEAGLGLMRDLDFTVLRDNKGDFADWTPEMDAFVADRSPLIILKANRKSTVHRSTQLDFIGVKTYDAKRKAVGQHTFVGLFTSAAYNRRPASIPLLRGKVRRTIERAGFAPVSHDAKALTNVLETYPRDELFQCTDDQLFENSVGVLQLATRPRTRLFIRPDRFGRFKSCLVFVPRERYTTELRVRIGEILADSLSGRVAAWTPSFGDEALARVHFVIATTMGDLTQPDVREIENRILSAVRSWSDILREALVERLGEHKGHLLHARYGDGFGAAYREAFPVAAAVADVEQMELLSKSRPLGLKFYRRLEDSDDAVRFKLYRLGGPAPLSDCLPVLENMGLRILEERPYEVARGDEEVWVQDFFMTSAAGSDIDLGALREKLEEGFTAVWGGEVDDDPLNRLVLVAGLSIRDTALLRAYSRYLRQARIPYSIDYMEDALADNPKVAEALVALFDAMFAPGLLPDDKAREKEVKRIEAGIDALLESVTSLDVDRILRRFHNAIRSTLRTNYYQPDAEGRPKAYVSMKFDCEKLDELPLPRPWREIFVYATWVEGVHLRGGPVARGGLRWSDRKEDYRTEVLGLVKAQQVKNAVIVPVGSKGGFLPKSLPADGTREEVQAEAIRCYKTFLSGLLDITDNLDGTAVVPPDGVVRRDGDDPYLVVAADKGTATFSDIANGVAADYGFWLDDAFASGGSQGYDHKGMGITAKGAWEAVKRHFRELGHDIQSEPFTVIGVGDMSGDVFGNGMMLSDQIRLVAAFDHRDIFIDPDPDSAKGDKERRRLFALPRSSWQDYDRKLISKGGGVFSRAAKSIELTPEIQKLTGLKAKSVAPFELIRALLKVPSDLLWFGGIGTYIKAVEESHADVGDRANDAIRVDAREVGARVVGEGANLGVTQRGRIALAMRGVKINTDAVDNSAGVDCSDHEVNIKIALGAVVGAEDMTVKQRNKLLADMTDEVAKLVLRNNYDQTLAVSMVEARAPELLDDHVRFMQALEAKRTLDREVELLPSDEALAERAAAGKGLTRPEIAVLVAYAKNEIAADLVHSTVPDDPYMERFLIDYMPAPLRVKYKKAVLEHRLKREIIATIISNALVNETGPTLVNRLREETGATPSEVARVFVIAREVFGAPALTAEINALDNKVAASAQIAMHLAVSDMVASQSQFLLTTEPTGGITEVIGRYADGVTAIARDVDKLLSPYLKTRLGKRAADLVAARVPKALAERVGALELLSGALDIVGAAAELKKPVADVAATYFAAGARFTLDWLRADAREVVPADHWERIALGRLISDLRSQQSAIAAAALRLGGNAGSECVEAWASENPEVVMRADRLARELRDSGPLTVAKLAVASSQLRSVSRV